MPSAWLFVRISVNKAGVPKHLLLVGVCEKCAAKDDTTLLREGFADLRNVVPDMPEFKMQVVHEGSDVVNWCGLGGGNMKGNQNDEEDEKQRSNPMGFYHYAQSYREARRRLGSALYHVG
jgi:hypothetical protein